LTIEISPARFTARWRHAVIGARISPRLMVEARDLQMIGAPAMRGWGVTQLTLFVISYLAGVLMIAISLHSSDAANCSGKTDQRFVKGTRRTTQADCAYWPAGDLPPETAVGRGV
jgi:hypothetical protein